MSYFNARIRLPSSSSDTQICYWSPLPRTTGTGYDFIENSIKTQASKSFNKSCNMSIPWKSLIILETIRCPSLIPSLFQFFEGLQVIDAGNRLKQRRLLNNPWGNVNCVSKLSASHSLYRNYMYHLSFIIIYTYIHYMHLLTHVYSCMCLYIMTQLKYIAMGWLYHWW